MTHIDDVAINKILNDIDYIGPRHEDNIRVFKNVLNKCAAVMGKMFDVYVAVKVSNVDKDAISNEYKIAVRTVKEYIIRVRKCLKKLIVEMDMECIYSKDTPQHTLWLGKLLRDNTLIYLKKRCLLTGESLRDYILSTGPSWYLDIPGMEYIQACVIMEKLNIEKLRVNVTDDIAETVLKDIGYSSEIDYEQVTAAKLILQYKAITTPVKTDCYIRRILGGISDGQYSNLSKDEQMKVDLCVDSTRKYLSDKNIMEAIECGINSVRPCPNEFLVRVAKSCRYPIVHIK